MNKGHTKYYKMMSSVQSTMDENANVWNLVPIAAEIKNELDEIIQRIDAIYGNNHDNSKAITRKKEQLKQVLVSKVPVLAANLYVYGDLNNNEKLKEFGKTTKSLLENMKELDVVGQVSAVLKAAYTNLDSMARFGVSEPQITEIETNLDDYKHLIGEARNVRNMVYANIQHADQLIEAGNQLLRNRLDKIMKVFEINNPKFYDLYKRSRVLID
ncbi:hypothetical protein DMA11_01305 [Marinilabiliaceae bacterium JC017]|nr:hypothetical protein DMA11_01305 [Marinilabiliaceae bacterium JC017]